MEKPVIFILLDQLSTLDTLPCEIKKELKGYEKWTSKCIDFKNHYVASIPCSPSRANVYTGKNCPDNKVTDNTNNSWQDSMPESSSLPTMGSYFKQRGYKTRYIGKVHLTKTLDRNVVLKNKPTVACQDYLQPYDFDIFNKTGDNGFDIHGGFFNDLDVIEQQLPNGNDPDKCDFYDHRTKMAYDEYIPFLKSNKNNNKFLLVVNIQLVHDITYSNVINGPYSKTATLQFSGNPSFPNINSEYNSNYRMFYDHSLINKKSLLTDNVNESLVNDTPLYIARLYYIASDWYLYGITQNNLQSYQFYQTSYLQMIKQVDSQLEQLYDFLEKEGFFEKAVIVLTSDHGEYNGAHGVVGKGAMIYEQAWKVPLLISYPEMKEEYKGSKYEFVTSHIQLLPTIMSLSDNYYSDQIFSLGLFPSIFKNCKCLRNKDFKNVKLGLSVGYGPLLLPLLRSLQVFEINENLFEKIPISYNYFTIPGFSVSANIRYKENLYNVGYYFSIGQLFVKNLENFKFTIVIANSDLIKNLNTTFILYNTLEDSGIALVGTLRQILQQLWSDVYGTQYYFKQYKVVPFLSPLTIQFTDTGVSPTIYGNKIYSNSPIFNLSNAGSILTPVLTVLPSNISTLYDAGNPSSIYVYVGLTDYIINLRDTNPVITTWITPTIISGPPSGPVSAFTIYVCNDPIYQKARIYTDNSSNIPNIITLLSFLANINLLLDGNIIKVILALRFNLEYDIFNSQAFFLLLYLQSLTIYKLPGLGLSARRLIFEGFQVQIFNNTEDHNEIYNLADASRIKCNRKLCDLLLKKLKKHIKYQNLENIFISLPSDIGVTTFNEEIKNYILSDMPRIYNYSLLESNNYNVTNGGS